MNLNNILWVYNTGKILPKAPVVENFFGMNLIGEGIITTATGNPVSIVTNKAQNAISTILSYSPKQSGTGDPSPQNIRPIEGWTEANLGVNSETPTKTISLGGTYYGFEIDVERGVLRVIKVIADLGDYSWTKDTTTYEFTFFYASTSEIPNNNIICESYKMAATTADFNSGDNVIRLADTAIIRLRVKDSSKNGLTGVEFKTAVTGTKIVYELATPLELPLTPQTVSLLAGNNTLWTDGDSVTITYRR